MNYRESTEFLLGLPDMERSSHGARSRTMSLEAMNALLRDLGNPQIGRKTAHLTGSKGKGSTAAYLASIIGASKNVSLYSSPHLHSYRERICFDLNPVALEDFALGTAAIKSAVSKIHESADGPISTFGALTALFFCLSRLKQSEWQVVEVGMGGLSDATNVLAEKRLAVITAISLEHTKILGKTTAEIAANKAGIIVPGADVVLAPQKDESVVRIIEQACRDKDARLIDVSREYVIAPGKFGRKLQSFEICSKQQGARRFRTLMLGLHQIDNAATAIAAADLLRENGDLPADCAIENAVAGVFVPGRMELLREAPLVVTDGAHNGESAAVLLHGLKRHFPCDTIIFVLGVNSDKDIEQIIAALKPSCRRVVATRSRSEKAMDPGLIKAAAESAGIECEVQSSSRDAIERALELGGNDELVCITGSLYLVAEAREYFLGEQPSWSLWTESLPSVI